VNVCKGLHRVIGWLSDLGDHDDKKDHKEDYVVIITMHDQDDGIELLGRQRSSLQTCCLYCLIIPLSSTQVA